MDFPTDIGEPQAEFEDAVCRLIESSDVFEIIERNMISDPFEPDAILMNEDEWTFRIVCWYQADDDEGFADIYPKTFGMRKWVTDHDEEPTYFLMGIGGTPQMPDHFYITRFFNIDETHMSLARLDAYRQSVFRFDFIYYYINRDLCRIFSPE